MKKLMVALLTVALSLTTVVPAFAGELAAPQKVSGEWTTARPTALFALELGEQFSDIVDEKERTIAIADYIKNNFVWDLSFASDINSLKAGKTRSFDALYHGMLTGAGIKVIGSTDCRVSEVTFDITQMYAQDTVLEIDGVRYWSSPLMYKYYGDAYLLRTDIPDDGLVGNPMYDLNMNALPGFEPVINNEVTGVALGSCLDD